MAKKIVAGNWKMNLNLNEVKQLIDSLNQLQIPDDVEMIVFPSNVFVGEAASRLKVGKVGVQNFFSRESGAFTGECSISQIKSIGANIGLIGHSERRQIFGESNELLKEKVNFSIANRFEFIFCCGEPLEIREKGEEVDFVLNQLQESLFHLSSEEMMNKVIAYEPVWAIGTGKTASSDQAESMHLAIRNELKKIFGSDVAQSVTILYGGSCNAGNAKDLFSKPNVDGGLIGGASLKPKEFESIIQSYE